MASVVEPDHPEIERAFLARALAGETVGNEERAVRVGEGIRWHLVSMFPLLDEGLTLVDETGSLVLRNASAERILRLPPNATDLGDQFPEGTVVDVDEKPMTLDHWPLSIALRTGQPARGVLLGSFGPKSRIESGSA